MQSNAIFYQKMRWLAPIITLLMLPGPAEALEQWEICLDKADFQFNVEGFLGSSSAAKQGCKMKFSQSGGKGVKYELDICEPAIRVDHYPAIDSNTSNRLYAGVAGCPAPLFGADYDENFQDVLEYKAARKKIFEIWELVTKEYGKDADKVNLSDPKSLRPEVSAGKVACGNFLLKEYLHKCMSFEGRQAPPPRKPAPPAIPGVHPETILVPKEKKSPSLTQ